MGQTEAGQESSRLKNETKQKLSMCKGQERLACFELRVVPLWPWGSAGSEAERISAPPLSYLDSDSVLRTVSLHYISISSTFPV